MSRAPTERWRQSYTEAPDVFDTFCDAEDPAGRIAAALERDANTAGREVLEVGAGTGRFARALGGRARRYVAVEPAAEMLRLARLRARRAGGPASLIRADAVALPLRSSTFDVALAGWVFAFLPPAVRLLAIEELARVLRPGSSLWLVENHWESEFQQLRGRPPERDRSDVGPLLALGFEIARTVDTQIRFPSPSRCLEIVGYLCGDAAAERLRAKPRARIGHRVVLLRRDPRRR